MYAKRSFRPRPFAVVLALLTLLIPVAMGCGGRKAKVSGSVTLDGKPLPAGTIVFHPSKGNSVSGEIHDGQYTVTGAPTGEVKVTVDTAYLKQEAEALAMANQNAGRSMGSGGQGAMPPEAREALGKEKQRTQEALQRSKELQASYRAIPDKYTKSDSSPITTKIKSGANSFDVDLSSK